MAGWWAWIPIPSTRRLIMAGFAARLMVGTPGRRLLLRPSPTLISGRCPGRQQMLVMSACKEIPRRAITLSITRQPTAETTGYRTEFRFLRLVRPLRFIFRGLAL